MIRREIADELGLAKEQIQNWVARYNRRDAIFLQERETMLALANAILECYNGNEEKLDNYTEMRAEAILSKG